MNRAPRRLTKHFEELGSGAQERRCLEDEICNEMNFAQIVGKSASVRRALKQERSLRQDSTVLIYGDADTGKELIARAIHDLSPRRRGCQGYWRLKDLMRAMVAASSEWISATTRSTVRSKSARSMMLLWAWVERAGTTMVVTGTPVLLSLMAPASSPKPGTKSNCKGMCCAAATSFTRATSLRLGSSLKV